MAKRGASMVELIEVRGDEWDALVFAGGQGAARVAEDQVARELAHRFAAGGRIVAALGDGRRVLSAARLEGFATDDPAVLLAHLARVFGLKEYPCRPHGRRAATCPG